MAVWFLNYSTWLGAHNLYLEDLYVRPEAPRLRHGPLLLQTLAGICRRAWLPAAGVVGAGLERPARGFYDMLGAEALTEWIPYRVSGEARVRLASSRR